MLFLLVSFLFFDKSNVFWLKSVLFVEIDGNSKKIRPLFEYIISP